VCGTIQEKKGGQGVSCDFKCDLALQGVTIRIQTGASSSRIGPCRLAHPPALAHKSRLTCVGSATEGEAGDLRLAACCDITWWVGQNRLHFSLGHWTEPCWRVCVGFKLQTITHLICIQALGVSEESVCVVPEGRAGVFGTCGSCDFMCELSLQGETI
jgi:hypothetical protein